MTEHKKTVESHGCIVCGKSYNVLVVSDAGGKLVDCTVTGPGGHRVPDPHRPLVACDAHPGGQIEAAYARRQAAKQRDETGEDD